MVTRHEATGKTAWSLHRLLAGGELSSVELVTRYLRRIAEGDGALNSFIHVDSDRSLSRAESLDKMRAGGENLHPLAGIPIAIKDIIAVKGMPLTCASGILSGFVSPYSASVVERLEQAGMVVIGKTNMDEFGMGSSNESSFFGPVRNPHDPDRVAGGSSGGSAAAVAAGFTPVALGSDTGGSIRQPASFCGVVGVKPTYGRVSRFGLVAFASSLDQVGPLTHDVRDAALLLGVISGHDPRDSTSSSLEVPDYLARLEDGVKGISIGVAGEFFGEKLDEGTRERCEGALDAARACGMTVKEIDLPFLEYTLPAYYVLCTAEASSNLARYDGIRYGKRENRDRTLDGLYRATRSKGFGAEVKRRIMLGTYLLSRGYYDEYYAKTVRARAFFRNEIVKAFGDVDLILTPTTPGPAFELGEKLDNPVDMYLSDIFTTVANLTGLPAISIPCGVADRLPVGLQLMARPFDEETMFSAAHALEGELNAGRV